MNNQPTIFDKLNNWLKNSIGLKVFTIVFLVLILLIPISMIENLIKERERYQKDAISEVSHKWGENQTVTALILTIPYHTYTTIKTDNGNEKTIKKKKLAHFLPNKLDIDGVLKPQKRYRGIYEVVLYNSDLQVSGYFDKPDFEKLNIDTNHVDWDQAYVEIGLNDLRSVQNDVSVNWNGKTFSFDPGVKSNDIVYTGVSTKIPVTACEEKYSFKVDMKFNGSNEISFTPLGKVSNVTINSDWPTPSFNGAFLPDTRDIIEKGFTANWEVLHLNRNFPQEFIGANRDISSSNFGVELMMPIDEYQKSMRSVKYAVMFISLTFLIYFFSQIKNKVRMHPIQYLIVGLAICLFFTLLIALSEHIKFGYAYLIGSLGTIGLIASYSHFIFKDSVLTKILTGILIILYSFIYIIIQMQGYSLLIGSIGLFLILGAVMYLSRNIDWYNSNKE